jgi:hypothetical protein
MTEAGYRLNDDSQIRGSKLKNYAKSLGLQDSHALANILEHRKRLL